MKRDIYEDAIRKNSLILVGITLIGTIVDLISVPTLVGASLVLWVFPSYLVYRYKSRVASLFVLCLGTYETFGNGIQLLKSLSIVGIATWGLTFLITFYSAKLLVDTFRFHRMVKTKIKFFNVFINVVLTFFYSAFLLVLVLIIFKLTIGDAEQYTTNIVMFIPVVVILGIAGNFLPMSRKISGDIPNEYTLIENKLRESIDKDDAFVGYFFGLSDLGKWMWVIGPLAILAQRRYFIGVSQKGLTFYQTTVLGKFKNSDFFSFHEISEAKIREGVLTKRVCFKFNNGRKLNLSTVKKSFRKNNHLLFTEDLQSVIEGNIET